MAKSQAFKDGLPKPLLGQFLHSNFPTSRSEDHRQLKVSFIGDGTSYRSGYVDLWYRPDTNALRYNSMLSQEKTSLVLRIFNGRVHAVTESHTEPIDAEAAAELIARPLLLHVKNGALASIGN